MSSSNECSFIPSDTQVLIHATALETSAQEQIQAVANHPALHGLISIMPDAHAGAGCVIGFTGKFNKAVIPNIVGVDIGCGVSYVSLKGISAIDFKKLDSFIRGKIPLGMSQRKNDSFFGLVPISETIRESAKKICEEIEKEFFQREGLGKHLPPKLQLGSLGGGNHFIEVGCSRKDGSFHLIIHSGCRNLGKRIAEYYQARSAAITKQMGFKVPKGLEFLPLSLGGSDYMRWANVAQAYARYNRIFMLGIILDFFKMELDESEVNESIHNYISEKDDVIRKGAISAHQGERVIIPLNMADGSILGIGRGNSAYNCSAPHGAGRKHGRREMMKLLKQGNYSLDDFAASMQGIFTTSIGKETFDECKFAYKDPSEIEPFLVETVEITDRIRPLYNLKAAAE